MDKYKYMTQGLDHICQQYKKELAILERLFNYIQQTGEDFGMQKMSKNNTEEYDIYEKMQEKNRDIKIILHFYEIKFKKKNTDKNTICLLEMMRVYRIKWDSWGFDESNLIKFLENKH